ncbi:MULTISPECIES: hypothetical protein [unclassified Microbacterium]|uniref:hypothetical protein n=1 Tax=unclassified Microbacterium TaxID=2609290 RepID=UPI00214CE71E|nr:MULTISPECIES: hypothetical protein [unclassified Microbacterium]MCR2784870.1 hypothetical protein [Microbacterium sp. zg.B96]WIM16409.1 hypothetical protein QNO11_01880 [Microbacterium sp. zg-B96]
MIKAYTAALVVIGLAMTILGTVLPLGGGTTIALIGAAALGAGLVLIGIRMLPAPR